VTGLPLPDRLADPMETRHIDLVFYGMAADAVGAARGVLECPWPLTADEVRGLLATRFPGLAGLPYHLAQGTALLSGAAALQDRLELVILPPFAGG
jgi:hypothetical protein